MYEDRSKIVCWLTGAKTPLELTESELEDYCIENNVVRCSHCGLITPVETTKMPEDFDDLEGSNYLITVCCNRCYRYAMRGQTNIRIERIASEEGIIGVLVKTERKGVEL